MKRKLLLLICFVTTVGYAQTITTFNSVNMSSYAVVDGTIDHSATGANTSWNFNLTSSGTSSDTYAAPTSAQTTTFPGTTNVFTSGTNNIFIKETAGEISLTGATTPDLELNYSTDNALIGTFPLSFGYNNSDLVAGTFSINGVTGGFGGFIDKTVDAYGILNMNDVGAGVYSATVTRLTTVQTIDLQIILVGNIGTATQTSYYYYDNSNGNLVFRSNIIHMDVPIAGLDETTTVNESLLTNLLDVNENEVSTFSVSPNPANYVLHINVANGTNLKSVIVSDLNGRQVLQTNENKKVNVNNLQAGMYLVTIQTDSGIFTKKFIKN